MHEETWQLSKPRRGNCVTSTWRNWCGVLPLARVLTYATFSVNEAVPQWTCLRIESGRPRYGHDPCHTWASWHRQSGTSCDELKDLGRWKSCVMVDRYAKFGTEHLTVSAARIERSCDKNVVDLVRFRHIQKAQVASG